ncbi:MAG: AtpZ/AtpI family protein [Deltaproteobacteria bacterium]|nr:AtpZ/AtpI family protein [Deltaproteobacteria bacterium]
MSASENDSNGVRTDSDVKDTKETTDSSTNPGHCADTKPQADPVRWFDEREQRRKESRREYRQAAHALVAPMELAIGPVLGFYLGYLADEHLGTGPVLMVVGGLLGFVTGGLSVYRAFK